MNKEQIDEVFNYALTENLKEIFSLVGMQNEYTDEPNDELINEVLNRLMKKIEQGDYEYFLNKTNDGDVNIRQICIELLKYSSKTEDKKNIINNWEKYGLDSIEAVELIKSINDSKYTKECILEKKKELKLKSEEIVDLVQSIGDSKTTYECIESMIEKKEESILNILTIVDLVCNLDNPKAKDKCIESLLDKIEREELKLNITYTEQLIKRIDAPELKKNCILKKKETLKLTKNQIITLACSIDDSKIKDECIKGLLNEREKLEFSGDNLAKLSFSIDNPELRDEYIECIQEKKEELRNMGFAFRLSSMNDPALTEKVLRMLNDAKISSFYRESGSTSIEQLDLFLEIEGKTEYKSSILRMYQKNNDILRCNFDILDYIKYFGEDKINLISNYKSISDKIIGLSEPKILILANCISHFEKQYETEDWTPLAEVILNNIDNIDENLLQQILQQSDQNESHTENLIHLLINSNDMQITTIEEFNNYDEIKQQKTDELIESDIADECKKAVLERAFNHGLDIAQSLINKYGEDIDKIEDESLKKYIIALKEIVDLEDTNILKEVYKSIEPSKIQVPNVFAIEKMLKKEYAKLYNKELFKVENAERIEELGENIYDAGTDFNMMITSIRAYFGNYKAPENYYKDWNRPALSTQHFCCSYIRNDMMRTAPIPFVCFGFESMKEDSLVASGNEDVHSNTKSFVSRANTREVYYSPTNQIDKVGGHNEMDYYRIQEGEKKQPDYIVVFKTNGQIKPEHLEYAKQAQKDFDGKLPIVIVDVDRCLESEKNKVDEMVASYKENPTQELLSQIKQKIKNNDLTCTNDHFNYEEDFHFCEDINLNELEGLLKRTKGDLSIKSKMNIGSLDEVEAITKHVQGKSSLYNDFYKENGISKQVSLSDIMGIAEADKLGPLLDKVSEVQGQNKSTSLVHGVQHVRNVLLLSNYIGKRDGLSEEYMSILQEAAIYHDVMHERAGNQEHAKKGANWYYNNVSKNDKVAFLIAAHESKGEDIEELISKLFKQGIKPEIKAQLLKCTQVLQDADRLDILRYNIENPLRQRFDANRLNDAQNASLIEAVIELNTRQAIQSGYLHTEDGNVYKKSITVDRFVTDKDLQTCYRETTPEEREVTARELSQRINQIDLVQDRSEK